MACKRKSYEDLLLFIFFYISNVQAYHCLIHNTVHINILILRIIKAENFIRSFRQRRENLIGSFSTMNEMAGQGLLIRGTDYDTTVDSGGDLVLRLNYKLFYYKFMLYCMRNNAQHIVFSLSELNSF